jgi:hypothetical protein
MAVRAHELAVGDLRLDALETVCLPDQLADLHPFRTDVVELQDSGILQAAVCTGARTQDLDHIRPGGRSPFVSRTASLLPVQVASPPDVFPAALLALRLSAMEIRGQQNPHAGVAHLSWLDPNGDRRPWCRRRRPCNISGPQAYRRERHAKFAADLAERESFGSQPSRVPLLLGLHCHTNIGSHNCRTDLAAYNRTQPAGARPRGVVVSTRDFHSRSASSILVGAT